MTIAVVQSKAFTGASSGSFTGNVAAGNTVFIWLFSYSAGAAMSSSNPTFNGSPVTGAVQLMQQQSTAGGGGSVYATVWMLPNLAGGAASIAITGTGGTIDSNVGIAAIEVSGLGATPALDSGASPNPVTAGGNSIPPTETAGPTGNITSAPELILGMADGFAVAQTLPSSPWTGLNVGSGLFCAASWQVVTSSGSGYTYAPATGANNSWAAGVAAVLGSGGAATPAPQPPPPLIPPGFQSPMAFTAFQAAPQGGALVSGADTGSGADAGSLAAAVSDADTGAGADTGSAAVAVSDADTGSAADTGSVAVAVSDADTGAGADTGSVAVAVSDSDTGSAADSGSVATSVPQPSPPLIPPGFQSPMAFTAFRPPPQGAAVAVSDADTGTGADTGSVAVAVSGADTGAGADTGSVAVAVTGADTGAGADTGSVAVAVSGADTGSGADAGALAAAVSDSDTGSGADAGSVVVQAAPVPPPPPLIPPGFISPAAFAALQRPHPAALPEASGHSAAFLVFFP